MTIKYVKLTVVIGLLVVGCRAIRTIEMPSDTPNQALSSPGFTGTEEITRVTNTPVDYKIGSNEDIWGLTHHSLTGNRLVAGSGTHHNRRVLDIPLDGTPVWLVATPLGEGSIWVTMLADGRSLGYYIIGDQIQPQIFKFPELPPDTPPVLRVRNGLPKLITIPVSDLSDYTHITPITGLPDSFAYINNQGEVGIWNGKEGPKFQVDALLDARILSDETGRLLLLTGATDCYAHGVLGDNIESSSIVLIGTDKGVDIEMYIEIRSPAVLEGIAPIWADLNNDGTREIIVTQSDPQKGSRIAVYREDGSLLALGPAIGQGFRWRHPLVVAPFGPDGQLELAVVRTPHIGGVVEFYQLVGDLLDIVAEIPGYSTHTIGSRNLDNALAGDFDGDGIVELLLPDQTHTRLEAIQRTRQGSKVVWSQSMDGTHTTNLAAVELSSGLIVIGAGTDKNNLRIWLP